MAVKEDPNIIRQNIPVPEPGSSLGNLASGYADGGGEASTTYTIPSCGIEDCDTALFGLFNETIKFAVQNYNAGSQEGVYIKKPQVIFATGEKFALAKKRQPPRDKNQVLILPAISIRRTHIEQTPDDLTSRGMNQFTGDIVIKRKLAPEDQNYQNLVNKYAFRHLPEGTPFSSGNTGSLGNLKSTQDGLLLDPNLGNNIFEIFTIPQPQFFTANYDVIFWTSYHEHMNYMIETFMASFLPQGKMFRLGTDKGYWFMAYVDDSFSSQDNFDDFAQTERLIRYNFKMTIKGYSLVPNGPGNAVPIRRYLSAPVVSFDITESSTADILTERELSVPPLENKNGNQFILSDIEKAPKSSPVPPTNEQYLFKTSEINPLTRQKSIKYVKQKIISKRGGERSYIASDIKTLEEILLRGDK